MTEVANAWRRLVDALEDVGWVDQAFAGPASPDVLDAAALRFGRPLDPDVLSLYALTGGLPGRPDEMPPPMYVDVMFPSVDQAVDTALELRVSAAADGMPPGLWRDSWLPVFVLWADHVVAVDSDSGAVWFVWWEDTRILPVAPDLATFLTSWADLIEALPARYDASSATWVLPPGFDADTVPSAPA